MVDQRIAGVLLAVGATALLVSCTETTTGTAGAPAGSTEASAPALPERPGDLPVAGIEPCALITEQQANELQMDRIAAGTERIKEFGTRACRVVKDREQPYYSYLIMPVPSSGADQVLQNNPETQLTEVGGFPTVATRPVGVSDVACDMAVDVADGQMVYVMIDPISDNTFDQNQLCDMAKAAAEAAVATLKTLR
ncbi:uncharacterized protein DUF3558 [Tamaricihabitans halophyticus]|uniref:Uncharacterized protein DUF3558 n=1 Tax=Tamaricihabitans halophyticus TaxID=1262583 RepID=A0A4R2QYA0_9PSEU|nr:DUF3558 domain-containing protein [Tamaricihabitans halophyticus]TCP54159.1 uncharacterized protein DUF3558 [Tamaricihabitans halophyticus]